MQYLDAGRAARRPPHRGRPPRAPPTARGAQLHLQPVPGTDLALANGLLHVAIREESDRRGLHRRRAPPGFEAVRRAVRLVLARPGRADHRRPGDAAARVGAHPGRRRARDDPHRARRRAAQHGLGHGASRSSTWRWPSGCPASRFCGYGTITGQGNGQGGREHGQKADQLPGYRRLDDPAARAHVAAVWGVDPDDLPRPGLSAYEMLDRLGTDGGVRALLVMASNIVVSAPTQSAHVTSGSTALDFLVVSRLLPLRDRRAGRRRAADRAVGRGGRHDDQPRGPGHPPRGRPCAPPAGVRTDLQMHAPRWPSDSAGHGLLGRSARRSSTSCAGPARAASPTTRGSATSGSTPSRACSGRARAVDHPGTPRLFAERFPTPDGRARFHPRRAPIGAAEVPDADYPYYLTTGRLLHAVPVRHPDPAGRVAAPRPSPSRAFEIHPHLARRIGVERRRPGASCGPGAAAR